MKKDPPESELPAFLQTDNNMPEMIKKILSVNSGISFAEDKDNRFDYHLVANFDSPELFFFKILHQAPWNKHYSWEVNLSPISEFNNSTGWVAGSQVLVGHYLTSWIRNVKTFFNDSGFDPWHAYFKRLIFNVLDPHDRFERWNNEISERLFWARQEYCFIFWQNEKALVKKYGNCVYQLHDLFLELNHGPELHRERINKLSDILALAWRLNRLLFIELVKNLDSCTVFWPEIRGIKKSSDILAEITRISGYKF